MQEIFRGSATAVVTPFTESGIDDKAFMNMIEYQISHGTAAIVAAGTTGEPATMTAEERRHVISLAIQTAAGRVPVIAGTGSNNTAMAIASSREAEALGADALLVVTPYYNKTSAAGLVAHYHAIADAVNIPIIVYNVPSRTGLNLTPEILARVAAHPRIIAVKEASGDIKQVLEIRRLCPDLCIYSGTDELNFPILACGGSGSVSVTSNVAPETSSAMHTAFFAGDLTKALELHLSLAPLTKLLFSETSPIPVKAALSMMGMCEELLRLPLVPMSDNPKRELRNELVRLGILA